MNRLFKRTSILALVVTMLLMVSACSQAPADDSGDTADNPSEDTTPSQVVVASSQEPNTLLPQFDLLTATHEVLQLANDCLFVVDETGEYVPQLATEVPTVDNGLASEDGRQYTVHLREGVTWQDGEPFTSADVKFTWEVITDDDLPVPSRTGWSEIESVETPDDYTVVFNYAEPNVTLLGTLSSTSCAMLPKHALEGENIVDSELNRKPIGNGPYKVTEWKAGSYIKLERNANYWQEGKPVVDEIVWQIIPSTEGMRAALERGDVGVQLFPSVADQSFIRSLDGYDLKKVPDYAWWQFWVNTEKSKLSDVRVRQALEYAIDKQAVADSVFRGDVDPMYAAFPPNHWAHNPDVVKHKYDVAQAEQLLEDAGWTEGEDGFRYNGDEKLSIEILNIAGEQERVQVIQLVQEYWKQVGVEAKIRQIDAANFPPTMAEGDYDIAYGWFSERHEPTFSLWLGTNWQRYNNEDGLDLLRQSMTTPDRQQRKELLQDFQSQAAEDVPVIFLVPRASYSAYNTELEGFNPSLTGNLWNAEEWRWK